MTCIIEMEVISVIISNCYPVKLNELVAFVLFQEFLSSSMVVSFPYQNFHVLGSGVAEATKDDHGTY